MLRSGIRGASLPKKERDMNNDQILNDNELNLVVGSDRPAAIIGPCGHPDTGNGSAIWNQFAGTLASGAAAGVGAVLGIL
jgi:hypothetical protein